MTSLLLMGVAFFVGALLAVQVGVNTQLVGATRGPVPAAAVSFAVGTFALVAITVAAGAAEAFGDVLDARPEHVVGGLLGAVYLAATLVLFSRIGAALSVGLFITGQRRRPSCSTPSASSGSRPGR